MLNQEYITLANYRLKTACETLDTAKILVSIQELFSIFRDII